MKILLISANRERFPDPVFPLGISYISHNLKKAGYDVAVFDACFSSEPLEELKSKINETEPDVIGISIRNVDNNAFPITNNYLDYYKDLVSVCRVNSSATIVLGGAGFSIFPEFYVDELKADYGIKGEGEFVFLDLLKKIEKNEKNIEKVIYSPLLQNIDFDDFPKRDGFDIDTYYKYSGSINIQTKRGCPFHCVYCSYPVLEGGKYRFRGVNKVVDEIQYWAERGVLHFFFVDSVFNDPEDYAAEICREIIKRKLNIKWTGFFIPKIKNKDFLDLCMESGLSSVDFGTDAFSNETLKGFRKPFNVDDIFESCDICNSKNIKFNHSLILGGPNETVETLNETIANVDKTKPTSVIAFIGVRVYPNTEIANLIGSETKIGLEPLFYISEGVKDIIVDKMLEVTETRVNWIVQGLDKGVDMKLFERIRKKGIKGPLWEMFSRFV